MVTTLIAVLALGLALLNLYLISNITENIDAVFQFEAEEQDEN